MQETNFILFSPLNLGVFKIYCKVGEVYEEMCQGYYVRAALI